jgi:hypothetical protein
VVVLRPPGTDEVTTGALARVRGELTAAGFDVREIPQEPGRDVRDALETAGRDLDPIATFAIVRVPSGGAGGAAADIWVCDRLTGKSMIQSVHLERSPSDPERGAAVLAVQAVELLKASLAQYWIVPAAPPPREPAPPRPEATAPAPAPELPFASLGLAAEAGVGWLDSMGAVGAVWEPIVRLSYGGPGGWAARLSFGGLGSDTELHAAQGSAALDQSVGTLEAVRSFHAGDHVQLFGSAGAGVYRLHVTGVGTGGAVGTVSSSLSALAIAGGGVALPLGAHFALVAEGQALVTAPSPVVRIAGAEVGRTGRPSLLASAGLLGRF